MESCLLYLENLFTYLYIYLRLVSSIVLYIYICVNNLSNPRTKTSALRELLTKERAGFEMEPKNSHHLFSC